jgi:hypothetical protein
MLPNFLNLNIIILWLKTIWNILEPYNNPLWDKSNRIREKKKKKKCH